jgi:CubicO group peptidase (beta-lactamase class C family)
MCLSPSARRSPRALAIACSLAISGCSLPVSTAHAAPKSPRIDPVALAALEARARATESDTLVVYHNGTLVVDWQSPILSSIPMHEQGIPLEAMSATKSVVALAIGKLIDTGKLKSVDQPVCDLFPEWRQGRKQKITIRHLLEHTSGLQNYPNTTVEIFPSPDYVKLALAAELVAEPGKVFSYNNKAINLLAGIVKAASGRPLDQYIRDEIFTPMGITGIDWVKDDAGNPYAMSGLQITAHDLARIGQMMLDGGTWQGKRIISAAWIAAITQPSESQLDHGMLWWMERDYRKVVADDALIAQWRSGGLDEDFITRVLPLKDRVFTDRKTLIAAIDRAVGRKRWDDLSSRGFPAGRTLPSPSLGFAARGYLGQHLVVIPSAKLVAVRQRVSTADEAKANNPDLNFIEFGDMVRALVR